MTWFIIGYFLGLFCPSHLTLGFAYRVHYGVFLIFIIFLLISKNLAKKNVFSYILAICGFYWCLTIPHEYCQDLDDDHLIIINPGLLSPQNIVEIKHSNRSCLAHLKQNTSFSTEKFHYAKGQDLLHSTKSYYFSNTHNHLFKDSYIQSTADKIYGYIDKKIKSLPHDIRPWFRALLLGDKSGIEESTKVAFCFLGIYHIVVISGLHFGFFNQLLCDTISIPIKVLYSFRFINPRVYLICKILGHFFTMGLLFLYAKSLGFPPPIQRSYFLFLVHFLGTFFCGSLSKNAKIYTTLICQVIMFPIGFYSTATFMSWGAYLFIAFETKGVQSSFRWMIRPILMTSLSGFLFGQLSIIGIFVNFLIIPIFPYLLGSCLTIFIDDIFDLNMSKLTWIVHTNFIRSMEFIYNVLPKNGFLYYDISSLKNLRLSLGVISILGLFNFLKGKSIKT